jgi:hypothetical protein
MSIGDQKLFLYADTIDLVFTAGTLYVDNRTMNIRKLNAHKGLTNTINFVVRDRDRRLQDVANNTVTAYMISQIDSTRLVSKPLTTGTNKGQLTLVLTEGDLRNIDPGLYSMYVTYGSTDCDEMPLYADQNNNIKFDIEVTGQATLVPPGSEVSTTFFQVANTAISGGTANIFVSNSLTGNQLGNFINSQHSMVIYPSTFTGNIWIQGSCLTSVPDQEDTVNWDWFNIKQISLTEANTAQYASFIINANWLRIKYIPDNNVSVISKVLVRN